MTMPTLMNCSHSGYGWCLNCVRQLAAELDEARAEAQSHVDTIVANTLLKSKGYQLLEADRDKLAAEKAALEKRLDDAVNQREYWQTKCHADTAKLRSQLDEARATVESYERSTKLNLETIGRLQQSSLAVLNEKLKAALEGAVKWMHMEHLSYLDEYTPPSSEEPAALTAARAALEQLSGEQPKL